MGKLINEWRKTSLNFASECLLSTNEYYDDTFYHPSIRGAQLSNTQSNDFVKKATFLKLWFEVNCNCNEWKPSKIADFGFGVANPLCAMINAFQPSFVYASEIHKVRFKDFRDIIYSNKQSQVRKNDRFHIEDDKQQCHIVIDNRDLKTFCDAIKEQKECDFIKIKHGKLQHICSADVGNIKCGGQCQESVYCLDLCLCYDVAEYLNDYDLQYCMDTIAEISYYLYFAVPTIKEYKGMEKEFDDKWAIHRSKKEYQQILLKSWNCVGNSIWESKVKCKDTEIDNNVCHFG